MKFHLMQTGVVGRRHEIEAGMAGQRNDLYQRFLEEIRGYVRLADDLGYYGYCQPEHHLQIEGFEANNHPGMFSLFVGQNSKRLKAGIMGYTMTTHNPVRVAEEIATLDHICRAACIAASPAATMPAGWIAMLPRKASAPPRRTM